VSTSLRKHRRLGRVALALVAGAVFLASVATLVRAGTGLPGSALFGYYDISEETGYGEYGTGVGDSILRLINPSGNASRAFGRVTNQCAMIYVFDDDEEMGECCGCPVTPSQLATFSFRKNLISNWSAAHNDTGNGAIAIRSAVINDNGCQSFNFPGTLSPACNGGCDPTIGYNDEPTLLGSITHVQQIDSLSTVTEVSLFGDGPGDPTNNTYLISQCSALVGNGSGAGICNCPAE
jgi:hypothetical protein